MASYEERRKKKLELMSGVSPDPALYKDPNTKVTTPTLPSAFQKRYEEKLRLSNTEAGKPFIQAINTREGAKPTGPVQYKPVSQTKETLKNIIPSLWETVTTKKGWKQVLTQAQEPFTRPFKTIGELGAVGYQSKIVDKINQDAADMEALMIARLKQEKDPVKAAKLKQRVIEFTKERVKVGDINPSVEKTVLQVIGEAANFGLQFAGGGVGGRALQAGKKVVVGAAKKSAAKAFAKLAITETIPVGASMGVAQALADNERRAKELAKAGGIGAAMALGFQAFFGVTGLALRNLKNFRAAKKSASKVKTEAASPIAVKMVDVAPVEIKAPEVANVPVKPTQKFTPGETVYTADATPLRVVEQKGSKVTLENADGTPQILEARDLTDQGHFTTRTVEPVKPSTPIIQEKAPAATSVAQKIVMQETKKAFAPWKAVTAAWRKKMSPLANIDDATVRQSATQFRNNLELAPEVGNQTAARLSHIPKSQGKQTLIDYSAGKGTKYDADIRQLGDALYKEAVQDNPKLPYRKNYVPQAWKEKGDVVANAAAKYMKDKGASEAEIVAYLEHNGELSPETAKRLGMSPTFDSARLFPDYQTGIDYGLTPKYNHPAEAFGAYAMELQAKRGNRQFIDSLKESGNLVRKGDAPKSWVDVTPSAIPGDTLYAAPKDIANFLNQMFHSTSKFLKATGSVARFVQEVPLSAGIPKTNINYMTFIQLSKSLAQAFGGKPGALTTMVKSAIRSNFSKPTMRWFAARSKDLIEVASMGEQTGKRMGNFQDLYATWRGNGVKKFIGKAWDKAWNEKTFKGLIPMAQLDTYIKVRDYLVQKGMSYDAAKLQAFETMSNDFGLLTQKGRSPNTENALSTIFLAPKFRENVINVLTNAVKSVTTKIGDPTYARNRAFIFGVAVMYGMYNALNKATSGHYMWENDPDHRFSLQINRKDGKVAYVPFMPGFTSIPKNAIEGTVDLVHGRIEEATRAYSSFGSILLRTSIELSTNRDHFGRPIFIDNLTARATGQEEDTAVDKIMKLAKYAVNAGNHPLIAGMMNRYFGDGEKSDLEILAKTIELPVTFSTQDKIKQQAMFNVADELTRKLSTIITDHRPEVIKAALMEVPPDMRAQLLAKLGGSGYRTDVNGLDKLTDEDFQRWFAGPHPEKIQSGKSPTRDISKDNIFKTYFPDGTFVDKGGWDGLVVWWRALKADPTNTLKAMFGDEVIRKIEGPDGGDTVVFERKSNLGKLAPDKNQDVDHVISLALGGSNDGNPYYLNQQSGNLKIMLKQEKKVKDAVELKLISLHRQGKITKKEAQKRVKDWQNEFRQFSEAEYQTYYVEGYKGAETLQEEL